MWQAATSAVDSRWLQSKHIFVGETRIATKNGYGEQNSGYETEHQYWYHEDHLGSAQQITDYQGELYERIEYTPYGETWIEHKYPAYNNTDIPYRFTGKELDAETGLYYYGARYLDPRTSRWLSADPAMGEYVPEAPINEEAKKRNGILPGQGVVFNLVNLHVYHYAGNNPVKYTDPDGRSDAIPFEGMAQFVGPAVASGIILLGQIIVGIFVIVFPFLVTTDRSYSSVEAEENENKTKADAAAANIQSNAQAASPTPAPQQPNDQNEEKKDDNPYKGKTNEELDKHFREKGYTPKGSDPMHGQGSYIDESTGTKYYIDNGGYYRVPGQGVINEPPHVDVEVPNLPKVRYEL
jgi:RHS repeat-associated protein